LDNSICDSADQLAGRLPGVSCGGWAHPSVAGIRTDLVDLAFCDGQPDCVGDE
jgi:hypothetical protein